MFNYFSLVQNHAIYSKTDITLKAVPRKNFCKKIYFYFFTLKRKNSDSIRLLNKPLSWIFMGEYLFAC